MLNVALIALVGSGFQPTHTIINRTETTQNTTSGSLDYRAKAYLDSFVQTYFNVPKEDNALSDYNKNIQAYSDGQLPTLAQGQQLNPTQLKSATLLELTSSNASYAVTYVTAGKTHNTIFNVPYQKSGLTYVVNSQPYFTAIQKLQGAFKDKVQLGQLTPCHKLKMKP
ncbi:conjugal transfer protein [Lactococcus protaetiae]|uniref:conjugal transfer protein n=1 Tax=Lactococcus protaetiae TaxID=2592653 RepID=UPI00167FFEF8|nr:conjugal transfer protein [Lactococcus protaetiae]